MTFDLSERPRRNRRTLAIRAMVRETSLEVGRLVYPLFFHEDDDDQPLESLPGQMRWSLAGLVKEVGRAAAMGVDKVVLFPKVPDALKSRDGAAASKKDGMVPRAIKAIKAAHPEVCVITDVALDPYSTDGHDGYVNDAGEVDNDATLPQLAKQAVAHAKAGADIVAPSDMMDGRVEVIRDALDDAGFTNVAIMAYTAKYASAFYGPFREALDSAPRLAGDRPIPTDKTTYQMDPANVREALREVEADEDQGADYVMVKPAGPYLDVVRAVREHTQLPVAAYQVSGEYLMIKAAAASGYLEERAVVLESLMGIRRAGADVILTYFAPQVAAWLNEKHTK
ncbi:MAG: porphobilinogen synthase [Algisphaera sp.]